MTDISKKVGLDESSLVYLLNFIMDNVREDRALAMRHHDTVASLMEGALDADGGGIQISLLLSDTSEALKRFLDTSSGSIEQTIKVAKLISDMMLKLDTGTLEFSDDTRDLIEQTAKRLEAEKEENRKIVGRIGNGS